MHVASIWQIALATDPTFSSPVASVLDTDAPFTSIPAITGLTPSTNYLARVRYIDDLGAFSDWSDAVAFTTLAENTVPEPGLWVECEHDQAA